MGSSGTPVTVSSHIHGMRACAYCVCVKGAN